jgi:hypothetical protein
MQRPPAAPRALVIFIAVLFSAAAHAQTTRFVSTCGNDSNSGLTPNCSAIVGAKATVQGAINASANGDIIEIFSGTYTAAFNLSGKSLTIRPFGGGAPVLGAPAGSVIMTCATGTPTVSIQGIKFKGASITSGDGAAATISAATVTFSSCIFESNAGIYGGAVAASNGAKLTISDCTFTGNSATFASGALSFNTFGTTATVSGCLFESNTSQQIGAALAQFGATARFTRCRFVTNSAGAIGIGALACLVDSSIVVDNCLFDRNSASGVIGAIGIANGGQAQVGSCTFVDNTGGLGASLAVFAPSTAVAANCIFWGNPTSAGVHYSGSTLLVSDSIVQGSGAGYNILNNVDPLFVNRPARDYRLLAASPAIDIGSPIAAGALSSDLLNIARPINGDSVGIALPDLGCYEFSGTPRPAPPAGCVIDLDHNHLIDPDDLFIFLDLWFATYGGACP